MNNRTNNNFSLRKLLLTALAVGPIAVLPAPLWGLPATQAALDLTVNNKSSGATVVLTSPTLVTVTTPDRGIITWNNLGDGTMTVGMGDTLNFVLPGSTSSVLNRVINPTNTTQIDGQIQSNGRVFILNPNGVILGATASVNAAGFGASAIAEPDGNFIATGSLNLLGTASGPVTVTSGANISTLGGTGDVFLAGTNVNVAGTISANNLIIRSVAGSTVALGSGGSLLVGTVGASTTGNVNVSGGASITVGSTAAAAVTIVGNAILSSANPTTTTTGGTTTLSAASATSIGGNLTVTTGGGAASLGGSTAGLTTTVGGNSTITTTGATVNGAVTGGDLAATTSAGLINNGSGRTTSIVAGGNSVAGGTIALGGDFTLLTVNGGTTSIRDRSGTIALGNSTITSAGTAFTITSAGNITNSGTLTISNTTSGVAADVAIASGGTANLGIAGAVNFVTLTGTNNITVAATGDITATNVSIRELSLTSSGGKLTTGNLTTTSTTTLVAAGDITIGTLAHGNANSVTITSNGGKITTSTLSNLAAATITAAGDISLGAITANNALTITSNSGRFSMGGAITASTTSITTAGDISISSTITTSGTNGLTLRSNGSSITQTAAITNGGTTTINAAGSATLTSANNFTNVSFQNGAGGIAINDTNGVVVTSGNATGATTITAGGIITLGAAITDAINFGSSLTLESGANNIVDAANNVFVFGALNLGGTGAVTLDNLGARYGQVNTTNSAGLASLTIIESTTLNLGAIKTTGSLDARSANGDVVNSGKLDVGTTSTFGAGSLAVPGDITLSNATNVLAGTVSISAARNVALTNTVNTTLATVFPILGNATFTQSAATSFTANNVDFNTFGGTFGGAVTVTDNNDITVQNLTVTGTGAVNIGAVAAPTTGGNVRLGSGINISTTGMTMFVSNGATSSISDTANGIFIFGDVTFDSDFGISLTRAGHSFGGVSLLTLNNGNATIVESGTLRLSNVSINGTGALSATSTSGNIVQTAATSIIAPSGSTFNAPLGGVDVSTGVAANQFGGSVTVTARDNVDIRSNGLSISLGNVTVTTGTLNVLVGNGLNITQAGNTAINAFGNTTFTTSGVGLITIDNAGNNFGGLAVNSGTGAVTVREKGTLNIRALTGSGGATLTSETADIVNSGAITTTTGALILNAANGNITALNTTNNFSSPVRLVSRGDASIYNTGALTLLGGTDVGGALLARTTNANISDSGSLRVSGNTTFEAGSGLLSLNDNNNSFGAVRFQAGGGTIVENTSFNLRGGSVATGAVVITTSGDFITSGVGGSSFTGNLTINALGSITPGAGSLLVVGSFTVNANGTKNLSMLSKSGNLANQDPINLGPGAYIAPGP